MDRLESICVDEQGHDYELIGYLVCADQKSAKKRPVNPNAPGLNTAPLVWGGTMGGVGHYWDMPVYLTADIEVHQCKKCGEVKFMGAVFSKLMGGDQSA